MAKKVQHSRCVCVCAYLNVIATVVVKVEHPQKLTVLGHVQVFGHLDTLAESLAGVLLHLDVVEFTGREREREYKRHKVRLDV